MSGSNEPESRNGIHNATNREVESQSPRHESSYRVAIKNFSPMWFLISMDTGIISIIMKLNPYRFDGLNVLATIMFVWNLVLFISFVVLGLLRLGLFTTHVRKKTGRTLEELCYNGAPAIAYFTLVAQVSLTCSEAWGHGFTILAYVLWWTGVLWSVSMCSATVVMLSKRKITSDREISPVIFLPLISVMTAGTTGGIVANYSSGISPRLAVPVIIASFLCLGYAFFLAQMIYSIYLHRLLTEGPVTGPMMASLVVTVGPLGQFATGIQLLGKAASGENMFAEYGKGTFLTASAASSVSATCTVIALLVVGFAFLWMTVAWYIFIEGLIKGETSFGMPWWSLIFPMGVFTTALLNLSNALDSPVFRGLTSALLIFLLLLYLFNFGACIFHMVARDSLGTSQRGGDEREEGEEKND